MNRKIKIMLSLAMVIALILSSSVMVFAAGPEQVQQESRTFVRYDIATQEEAIITLPAMSLNTNEIRTTPGYVGIDPQAIIDEDSSDDDDGDDRIKVYNTTSLPYYSVVYIETSYDDGTIDRATGFMIAEDVLLTAAHAVKSSAGAVIEDVVVYPGRNGNSYTISTTADTIYTDVSHTGTNNWNWDYAIVTLNDPIGNTCGWFGLYATTNSNNLYLQDFIVAGYPQDKASGSNRPMYKSEGIVGNITTYQLHHSADTYDGESGAPLFYENSSGEFVVIGIQVGTSDNETYNIARRITTTLIDLLEEEGHI